MELPELKEAEVLVKIEAAGINPVDAVIREGHYKGLRSDSNTSYYRQNYHKAVNSFYY